jgi:serine/threonine protein kinase
MFFIIYKLSFFLLFIYILVNGIHFIHNCKITHRDLKEENIFVNYFGELKLKIGDLGLSSNKTQNPTMCGFSLFILFNLFIFYLHKGLYYIWPLNCLKK